MLFDKKSKKVIQIFWVVIGILVAISMIAMYVPIWQ